MMRTRDGPEKHWSFLMSTSCFAWPSDGICAGSRGVCARLGRQIWRDIPSGSFEPCQQADFFAARAASVFIPLQRWQEDGAIRDASRLWTWLRPADCQSSHNWSFVRTVLCFWVYMPLYGVPLHHNLLRTEEFLRNSQGKVDFSIGGCDPQYWSLQPSSWKCKLLTRWGHGVDWQGRVALLLGHIHAVEALFLQSILTTQEESLGSALAPFDVASWTGSSNALQRAQSSVFSSLFIVASSRVYDLNKAHSAGPTRKSGSGRGVVLRRARRHILYYVCVGCPPCCMSRWYLVAGVWMETYGRWSNITCKLT